jgi:mutual gliding-motility protein MglA
MVAINPLAREVTFKVVFYGPGLGGKTTSLQVVHDKARPEQRGKLVSLATPIDRTLYFDYLPYRLAPIRGMGVRLQLFTVPGQVHYNATRKLVLAGADGVVFVADSQSLRSDANLESFENLRDNLVEQHRELDSLPLVFQYNKRDLPDVLPVEKLDQLLNSQGAPAIETVAVRGQGIFEALDLITQKVLEAFEQRPVRALSPPPMPLSPGGGGIAEALRAIGSEVAAAAEAQRAARDDATAEGAWRGDDDGAGAPRGDEGVSAWQGDEGPSTRRGRDESREAWQLNGGGGAWQPDGGGEAWSPDGGGGGQGTGEAWSPGGGGQGAGEGGRRADEGEARSASMFEADDLLAMDPAKVAELLLGGALPSEPAPPSDPLGEIDADPASPVEKALAFEDGGEVPAVAPAPALGSAGPDSGDLTTLAPASFSFAELWPRRDRDAVLAAEGAMAAGDYRRAVELLDVLASRVTLSAVSLVGASSAGAAATIFAPLLLGVSGPRYASFLALVRHVRAGGVPGPKQALAAYALVVDLMIAKEQVASNAATLKVGEKV